MADQVDIDRITYDDFALFQSLNCLERHLLSIPGPSPTILIPLHIVVFLRLYCIIHSRFFQSGESMLPIGVQEGAFGDRRAIFERFSAASSGV